MLGILQPSNEQGLLGPAGWGNVPTIGGAVSTAIPDPSTGTSTVQVVQNSSAATQSTAQAIFLPPPPAYVMNTLDPSGALLMWAQNLIRRMGGYVATPADDAEILADTSETVDQAARASVDALSLFDAPQRPAPADQDMWPADSDKGWVKSVLLAYLTTAIAATTYQPISTEGTWAPTATSLGGTGIAYSAKWIKTGNLVFCAVKITGTGLTSTAASTTITGPAFSAARNSVISACAGSIVGALSSVYSAGGTVYLPTIASTTEINLSWVIFLT